MNVRLREIRDQLFEQIPYGNWEELGWQLRERAEELQGAEKALSEQLRFLASVFHMELTPSDKRQPYKPMLAAKGRRTALPEDFDNLQLAVLDGLLAESPPPIWSTRLADVLWICKFKNGQCRSVDYAQLAIKKYLQLSKLREKSEKWGMCWTCLERALGVAKEIGRQNALGSVIESIDGFLVRNWGEDPPFVSCHLIKLLLDCHGQLGDSGKYLQLSKELAQLEEQKGNFHKSEAYWNIHKQWAIRLQNPEARVEALIQIAEGYVKRAKLESAVAGGGAMVAAHWLEQAVETYRNLPQQRGRYIALYSCLRRIQRQALLEFKMVEIPVEIPQEVAETQSQFLIRMKTEFTGLDLEQCLYMLAFRGANYPDYSQLQTQAQELTKGSVSSLLEVTRVDTQGRIVSRRPATLGADSDEQEIAEWQMVMELARIDHSLSVHCFIEPLRQLAVQQHTIEESQLLPFCQDSSFVAPGQEALYAQGLYEGLQGNYVSATHLLVPLIENSLRFLVNQHGIETSQLKNGLQEEFPVSKLLELPVLTEVWGDNQTKDLKAILSDRSYANLRNRVAHGLMSAEDYRQPVTEYLWWTALRLVLFESASRNFNPENGTKEKL